tara:strand:- start:153 stop:443 length:291 start_codon:yes stop_codon:yes gene_type:complete
MVRTFKQKFNKKHGQPLNTSNSITKIARLSNISYKNAKQIFEKGEGAYFSNPSSVRKFVKSPQQWAYSRLYASVSPGSKSAKIDKDLLKKIKSKKK